MIANGTKQIADIRVGSTQVSKVMVGEELVWPTREYNFMGFLTDDVSDPVFHDCAGNEIPPEYWNPDTKEFGLNIDVEATQAILLLSSLSIKKITKFPVLENLTIESHLFFNSSLPLEDINMVISKLPNVQLWNYTFSNIHVQDLILEGWPNTKATDICGAFSRSPFFEAPVSFVNLTLSSPASENVESMVSLFQNAFYGKIDFSKCRFDNLKDAHNLFDSIVPYENYVIHIILPASGMPSLESADYMFSNLKDIWIEGPWINLSKVASAKGMFQKTWYLAFPENPIDLTTIDLGNSAGFVNFLDEAIICCKMTQEIYDAIISGIIQAGDTNSLFKSGTLVEIV